MFKRAVTVIAILINVSLIHAQEKPTLAVLDFEGFGISEFETKVLTNRLATFLVQTGLYEILERNEIAQILSEQDFQAAGCTTDECAVEIGQLLNAQFMLMGSYGKLGSTFTIDMRIIDVASGSIINTASYDVRGEIDLVLSEGLPGALDNLLGTSRIAIPATPNEFGKINIESDPSEARVIIDGSELGVTPQTDIELGTGVHNITLIKEAFEQLDTTIVIRTNQHSLNRFELEPEYGRLSLISNVDSAAIMIDGELLGIAPLDSLKVKPGQHVVHLEALDYVPIDTTITIISAAHTKLVLALSLPTVLLMITSIPEADRILVDSLELPTPVTSSTQIQVGQHAIHFEKLGYYPIDTTIVLSAEIPSHILSIEFIPMPTSMTLDIIPVGARISMDGYELDVTQSEPIFLKAGQHIFHLEAENYISIDTTIFIPPGQNSDLKFLLDVDPAKITIRTIPPGASVSIDRMMTRLSPIFNQQIAPGTHNIHIKLAGFTDVDTSVTLETGRLLELIFTLPKSFGWVSISGQPDGNIFINDVLINGAQLNRYALPPGSYSLVVKKKQHSPYRDEFIIQNNRLTELNYQLQYKPKSTAFMLSAMVPGAGQLYFGEFGKGITILALSAAIAARSNSLNNKAVSAYNDYETAMSKYNSAVSSAQIQANRDAAEASFNTMADARDKRDAALALYGLLWAVNLVEITF